MAKQIIIKPIFTEKSENLSEKQQKYSFVVNKKVNKIEIQKEIEKMYKVNVQKVNTMIMPARAKNRMTRAGSISGRISAYKKAIVTLEHGEEISFFEDI